MKAEAEFEITFDDVPDGNYDIIGAMEEKLSVRNNKAKFKINKTTIFQASDIYTYLGTISYYTPEGTTSIVRIKGIPFGTRYEIKEISARSINNDMKMSSNYSYHDQGQGVVGTNRASFYNSFGDSKDGEQFRLKLTKKVENAHIGNEEQEYEFTILPLLNFSSRNRYGSRVSNQDIFSKPNATMIPDRLYGLQLHGQDGDKIVDRSWFTEYIDGLWGTYIPTSSGGDEILLEFIKKFDWMMPEEIGTDMIPAEDDDPTDPRFLYFAEPERTRRVIDYVNSTTNNFFEYEGNRLIDLSEKLEAKIRTLGYSSTGEWFRGIRERGQSATTDEEIITIADEFINCFSETGWTVDDLRFVRLISVADMITFSEPYGATSVPGAETAYEFYNNLDLVNSDEARNVCRYYVFLKCDGRFDLDTNQYFFGRTFMLKDGESIDLNFPAWWIYTYGALIIEKKTGEEEYTQGYPIIPSMLHVEKDANGDYVANATYKNTYPEPESEQEPEKEEPKKPAVITPSDNPQTEDQNILPFVIMAGTAFLAGSALIAKRSRH